MVLGGVADDNVLLVSVDHLLRRILFGVHYVCHDYGLVVVRVVFYDFDLLDIIMFFVIDFLHARVLIQLLSNEVC